MALRRFILPDLGEGLQEAEIVEWHVSAGERVVADQPLLSVETDKAVVEVPSPWSGNVTAILANAGDVLPVGAPLVEINDVSGEDSTAIVGKLGEPALVDTSSDTKIEGAEVTSIVRTSPAARALAGELGINLAQLSGSGPNGVITRDDVEANVTNRGTPAIRNAARRSMAQSMAKAHTNVVPATITDVADITAWLAPSVDVTVRLVRAICRAASQQRILNSWYDPSGRYGTPPKGVALGLAVDTPHGLYVPVIPRADKLSSDDVRTAVKAAITRVRERRPASNTSRTPTITLSNFGPLGGRHAALVVVPPQVAILGAGRAYEMVCWRDDAPARSMALPLSLTFDHRAATGSEAARFLAVARDDLEQKN